MDFDSCGSPRRSSTQLTIGTSDSNGAPTKGSASLNIAVRVGDPSTSTDEADLLLRGSFTDVRAASDLSDHTGQLVARMSVQITDRQNTPQPGGPGAGTVTDTTYSFPIPCATTQDQTVGSTCSTLTTAEAFVPGLIAERRRSVWALGSLAIYDPAGEVFMTQGVFVP